MDGDLRRRIRPAEAGSFGYSATLPGEFSPPILSSAAHADVHSDAAPLRERRVAPAPEHAENEPEKDEGSKGEKVDEKAEKPPMPRWKKVLYWVIGLAVLAVLIVAGVLYWLHARQFENTDDAFIDGHMSQVSAQVAARVTRLAFEDNQVVEAGQLLVELDPRDYQVKLDQARAQRAQAAAQLDQANAQVGIQQASLDQALANVRVSEAELGQQQTDLARYRAIDPKAITRQQLDTSSAQTKSAAARLDASRQAVQGSRAQLEAQKASVEASAANLAVAEVQVANAELQLSYTRVVAPQGGRVTKRTVELGNYLNPGQSLLAVVPDEMWVTANFKETQLAHMQKGQPVRVRVDACPGVDLAGRVDSFQSGTGAVFSSLPAENATGNYVKVVQRVPVKIAFDRKVEGCRIAPGLSVSPRVTVRPNEG